MRKLATASMSFSAAVFLSQYLIPTPVGTYCGIILAGLSIFSLVFTNNTRLRIFLICLGLAAGFLWTALYSSVFYSPAKVLDGKTETVSAVVYKEPEITEYGSKILVRVKTDSTPRIKTQLYIYGNVPDVKPGYTIEFTARFRMAETIYGEKTESFFSKGIFLLGYIKGDLIVTDASQPIIFSPVRIAQSLGHMIEQIFPKHTISFMQALILGDTSGVYRDSSLSAALGATGTSHIVSVSGMNIAFLMGFMSLLIKKKRVLSAVGIPIIVFFMAVVGFMPPVTRAGIMQIFLLTAPIFKRENDTITSLSAALLIILLFNPYSAANAGLQLSFSATLGILLFTPKIYAPLDERLQKWNFYKYRLLQASLRLILANFATTIGALILSIPLIALHFGTVSLIAPLANLFILWAVTLAFCGGIVAVIIGYIYAPIGSVIAYIVAIPVEYCIKTISFFSHVPFASVYTSNPGIVIWLVYIYLLVIAFLALRLSVRQFIYPMCLSAITLCLVLFCTSIFSDFHRFSVTVLDVGQGQSIVVTSGKYTAVVDCGSSSGKDAGEILTKHLQSNGRTAIDLLILTHYHSDHANGVIDLMEREQISAIALPSYTLDDGALSEEIHSLAQNKGIKIVEVSENLIASLGGVTIMLFAPIGNDNENERGLSILCSENEFDLLITGDMNSEIEHRLVTTAHLPDIELLIVGHHGSKHSTSDELLDTVKPEIAIISVGYNIYGHPAYESLQRLAQAGIMTYRTDETGNIKINGW